MYNKKFYINRENGTQIKVINPNENTTLCGSLEELVPNTVEASGEKHVPAVTVEDGKVIVNVGTVDHPMLDEHFIEWVYVETDKGGQRKVLNPGEAPNVSFCLGNDKPVAVYAYCNLHGLWKTEL